MPGFTSMEVSANNGTPPSFDKQAHSNNNALQPLVKDEDNDRGDLFDDADDYDETVYKPRPQLPQPNVHMRSLASLISE